MKAFLIGFGLMIAVAAVIWFGEQALLGSFLHMLAVPK